MITDYKNFGLKLWNYSDNVFNDINPAAGRIKPLSYIALVL